jgi:hypothetical protein
MGGDEWTAVHQLLAAIADRPQALALLETLLLAVGRVAAANVVSLARTGANRRGWGETKG